MINIVNYRFQLARNYNLLYQGGVLVMILYDTSDYSKMLGSIADEAINVASCMGQCTGCKCSCKCSCSKREDETFEWEEF